MSLKAIGSATKSLEVATPANGVGFKVPYGEDEYSILLSDEEMDSLLRAGLEKLLGNKALGGFDSRVELENPDLPLLVGARALHIDANGDFSNDINMGVSVVTQSMVYEHRGILLAHRYSIDGSWSTARYDHQPPLREPEEVFGPEAYIA